MCLTVGRCLIIFGGGIFASECIAGIATRSCDVLDFVQRILRPCADFVKMSTHVMFFVTKILDNSYRHLAICVLVTLTISTGKNEKGSGYLPRWAVRVAGQLSGFFSRSVVIDIGWFPFHGEHPNRRCLKNKNHMLVAMTNDRCLPLCFEN